MDDVYIVYEMSRADESDEFRQMDERVKISGILYKLGQPFLQQF